MALVPYGQTSNGPTMYPRCCPLTFQQHHSQHRRPRPPGAPSNAASGKQHHSSHHKAAPGKHGSSSHAAKPAAPAAPIPSIAADQTDELLRLRRETPFICNIRFKNDLPEVCNGTRSVLADQAVVPGKQQHLWLHDHTVALVARWVLVAYTQDW